MKRNTYGTPVPSNTAPGRQAGFSFLEVLAGITVFAIGILGLALLQTNLTRSQADANARGVATAISERLLERTRGFAHLADDGGSGLPVYTAITATAIENALPNNPLTVGGVPYSVDARVFDYRWDTTTSTFVCWPNADNGNDARCTGTGAEPTLPSDYKLIEVETSWDGAEFILQSGTDQDVGNTDRLDSGTVVVSTVITSVPTGINAKVQTASDGNSVLPAVPYTPGQAPDVIYIDLGDNLRKESTTPIPDVLRSEYVETSWEVITYSVTPLAFQRREEFVVVSCECTLDTSGGQAYTPVYWAGDRYAGGELVSKAVIGSSATNQQSSYCTSCCRDHHDDTSETSGGDDNNVLYRPFDLDRTGGNHKHYDALGNLAGNRDNYLESCRMVRRDGFFRVAQDLRQEHLLVTPGDWLQSGGAQQATYGGYVTGAVSAYYEDVKNAADYSDDDPAPCIGRDESPPCAAGPPVYGASWNSAGGNVLAAFDNRTTTGAVADDAFPSWTYLASSSQQMRSRSIYIDYMSEDLRDAIECVDGLTLTPPVSESDISSCVTGEVDFNPRYLAFDDSGNLNKLSLIPFFELQLTKLSKWSEVPLDVPVDVTSEAVEDNNAHSRGVATGTPAGGSTVYSFSYRGNLGLTDTTPVRPDQASTEATLIVQSVNADGSGGTVPPPPPEEGDIISGAITYPGGSQPNLEAGGGAACGVLTSSAYECTISATGTLRLFGYGRNNSNIYVCSELRELDGSQDGQGLNFGTRDAEITFQLNLLSDNTPTDPGGSYPINIQTTEWP
jgi:type II secretory pathway pseudopilin PulG